VLLAEKPAHGTVSIVNGMLVYTPTPGYSGEDELRYTLVSPDGRRATATLSMTVVGEEPEAPGLGSLPFTGVPLAALLGTATALLVGGGVLLVAARRRGRPQRS
jgi:hypothetical protein